MPADQSITSREVNLSMPTDTVATAQTTTSPSYTDLATVGPSVSPASGITQDHLIIIQCASSVNIASTVFMSVSVNGVAASDDDARVASLTTNAILYPAIVHAAAMPTSATHTAKYRCVSQTATYSMRRMIATAV